MLFKIFYNLFYYCCLLGGRKEARSWKLGDELEPFAKRKKFITVTLFCIDELSKKLSFGHVSGKFVRTSPIHKLFC
jgi:hypothetical protein